MAEEKVWTKEKIKSKIEENELDLSLCGISKVPVKNMLSFKKVTVLDLSCNKINILPDNFTKLVNLVHLDLSKNSLTELPTDFGTLKRLIKLDLLNNHLSELPQSFRLLDQLKWLDLKGNPIQDILPSIVGDCLKPSECQLCAKNVVSYYGNIHNENVEKERKTAKREQGRLLKQQKDEDILRQRRKEEKKRRHDEKKLINETKKLLINNTQEYSNDENISQPISQGYRTGSSCFRVFCYIILLWSIAGIVMAVIFKGNLNELNSFIEIFIKQARTRLNQLMKSNNK